MFSQRRIRLLAITAVVAILLYLHYSGEDRSPRNQKFYQSTVAAIEAEKQAGLETTKAGGNPLPHTNNKDESDLKPGEEYSYVDSDDDKEEPAIPKAKPPLVTDGTPSQPEKEQQRQARLSDDDDDVEEIPIAGRTTMTVTKEKDPASTDDYDSVVVDEESVEEEKKRKQQQEEEEKEVKAELNAILKRSPIIIFSKSFCPYSKKAKTVLLDKYTIVPAPFVVELDQHPLGRQLQALLGQNTGRRTVPNVLVNGRSIGGGDDIVGLDEHDELASRLKSLGGKWLQDVKRKPVEEADE
ncbi:glutaredoxin domain protein [Aspergillus pseudoustus]|uniref:Glutaredoxin domain protein n=1 Tax=Aspergillus pseudoustus TaxID=1810923 RepID=A0ABR4ISG0_9EURO